MTLFFLPSSNEHTEGTMDCYYSYLTHSLLVEEWTHIKRESLHCSLSHSLMVEEWTHITRKSLCTMLIEHLWAKVNNTVGIHKKTGSGFSQAYFWQVVWFPVSKPEIEESGLHRECFCCIRLLICHMTTHQMTSISELCQFFRVGMNPMEHLWAKVNNTVGIH